MLLTATLGLIVGTPLGFVIHRGSFCMHSGFRQTLGGEPSSSFLAYLLALGCQLLLVNSLAAAHLVHSGFRQTLGGEPSSSFLAYLLALGCQLLFVNSLAAGQLLVVPVPPLTWLAATVGGLMFGFGMVWAKG